MKDIGIPMESLHRYIDDQIYSLPGVQEVRQDLTILLTGSRAHGTYTEGSDVDLDVICPEPTYRALHEAAMASGLIRTPRSFFVKRPSDGWEEYFGADKGRPHFTVMSLDQVENHFATFRDVWMWVWTNALIITDPREQFERLRAEHAGYPADILVTKIKYHWLLAGYWSIDVFPLSSQADDSLLAAATAIVNTVNEHLRLCFLVEGKPFPYSEKLMRLVEDTELGRAVGSILGRPVDLVLGKAEPDRELWQRLEEAFEILNCYDLSEENRILHDAFANAMVSAGVEPDWVEADYDNIDELLLGELGVPPE